MSIEVDEGKMRAEISQGPFLFSVEHRKYKGLRPTILAFSLEEVRKQLRWRPENLILTEVRVNLDITEEYAKSIGLKKIAETPGMGAYVKREYAFT